MTSLSLGFALTQHCNLRCPHCIRDDVTSFAEIDVDLVIRILDQARTRFEHVTAGFTGGEPLLHREWPRLIEMLRERAIPYTFISNGWHIDRFVPLIDRYAPAAVRFSLSGSDQETHDAERGRGSFQRVLLATMILTSRRVPLSYAMCVDKRTRYQLRSAWTLAQEMGVVAMRYTLPQPVPGSAERDSDLAPEEWWTVRRELAALAEETTGTTQVIVDYGAPALGVELECDSKTMRRMYVDVHGRLSTCCQLSEYGANESDVVVDLATTSFDDALELHKFRIDELKEISLPRANDDGLAAFPCLRCARATGKLAWLTNFPESPWHFATQQHMPADTPLVKVTYSRRARRSVSVAG